MGNLSLYTQIELLPDELKKEVADFVQFLIEKEQKKSIKKSGRKPGMAKGLIEMKPGFDDPIEDFKEYM